MKNLTPIARASNLILVIAMISVIPTLVGSCSNSSFSGTSKVRRPVLTNGGNGIGSTAGGPTAGGSTAGGTATGDPTDSRNSVLTDGCLASEPNLYVMFVVDATASMNSSFDKVKRNIATTAKNLRTMQLAGTSKPITRVKFAAVSYVDDTFTNYQTFDFTDNESELATWVGNQKTRGGIQDHCEGGLLAMADAMQRMKSVMSSDPNALPILIPITDNYSHAGGSSGSGRDFSTTSVLTEANDNSFNGMMIFDSSYRDSGPVAGGDCNEQFRDSRTSPAAKWEELRNQIKGQKGGTFTRGASLGFPLSDNALTDTLPAYLKQHVRICK